MDEQIRQEFESVRKEMRDEFSLLRKEIAAAMALERDASKQDRHDIRDWLQENVTHQITVVETRQENLGERVDKNDHSLYGDTVGLCGRMTIVEQVTAGFAKAMDTSRSNWWQAIALIVASASIVMWAVDKIWK